MFLPFIIVIISSITINVAICTDAQKDYSHLDDPRESCQCPDSDDPRMPCACPVNIMDCECVNAQEPCLCPENLIALMKRIRNYNDLQNKPMKTSIHKKSNTKTFLQKLLQRVKTDAGPTPIMYLLKMEE